MSLDGLRAWIGLVERKLRMRTRVFLVLVAIAVGGAGAGIYLAVEAQNDQVTEGDLQALQEELRAEIGASAGQAPTESSESAAQISSLTSQVEALRAKVESLEGGGSSRGQGK
jgi:uncharacterized protein HemX